MTISPIVAFALTASIVAGIRFASWSRATSTSAASAACAASSSRAALTSREHADLALLGLRVDLVDLDLVVLALVDVAVDADHGQLAGRLALRDVVGEVGDLALEEAQLDRAQRPAQLLDLVEVAGMSASMRSVSDST